MIHILSHHFPKCLFLAAACIALSGCSSSKAPTFSELSRAQGAEYNKIGENWDKGDALINEGLALQKDGQKNIKKGEKLLKTGNASVKEGKAMVKKGAALKEQAEAEYKQQQG